MPWFVVAARLEAEGPADAMRKLRRLGTAPENVEQINDEGTFVLERAIEAASPWRPADSAPKDRPFIGYDRNIAYAETVQWDPDKKKFLNFEKTAEARFTEWMGHPAG